MLKKIVEDVKKLEMVLLIYYHYTCIIISFALQGLVLRTAEGDKVVRGTIIACIGDNLEAMQWAAIKKEEEQRDHVVNVW